MTRAVVAALLVAALVACGGKLAPADIAPDASANGEGMTTGTGAGTCASQPIQATRACVPARGREKSAIQIEIDHPGGCLPCGGTIEPCRVDVRGSDITITTSVQLCAGDSPTATTCACASEKTTCQLPPLEAGTFTVHLANEDAGAMLPPRQLVIQPTGEVACTLSAAPSIDVSDYFTGCNTDADCTLATTGNSCAPCACPNAAISTRSATRYQGDFRAATSQCDAAQLTDVACAGCAQRTAICNANKVCDLGP